VLLHDRDDGVHQLAELGLGGLRLRLLLDLLARHAGGVRYGVPDPRHDRLAELVERHDLVRDGRESDLVHFGLESLLALQRQVARLRVVLVGDDEDVLVSIRAPGPGTARGQLVDVGLLVHLRGVPGQDRRDAVESRLQHRDGLPDFGVTVLVVEIYRCVRGVEDDRGHGVVAAPAGAVVGDGHLGVVLGDLHDVVRREPMGADDAEPIAHSGLVDRESAESHEGREDALHLVRVFGDVDHAPREPGAERVTGRAEPRGDGHQRNQYRGLARSARAGHDDHPGLQHVVDDELGRLDHVGRDVDEVEQRMDRRSVVLVVHVLPLVILLPEQRVPIDGHAVVRGLLRLPLVAPRLVERAPVGQDHGLRRGRECGGAVALVLEVQEQVEGIAPATAGRDRRAQACIRIGLSNNIAARQLYLALGTGGDVVNNAPATLEKSHLAVQSWLSGKRLNFPELVIENGSGLSRKERISARHMGKILVSAYQSPVMPEFMSSLPIAAADGTLKSRYRDTSAKGRAHMKTGALDNVRALAGYVLDQAGNRHVVVFFVNHDQAEKSRGAMDALVQWIANKSNSN